MPSVKAGLRFYMLKKFDSDQIWVALILALLLIFMAGYRLWTL